MSLPYNPLNDPVGQLLLIGGAFLLFFGPMFYAAYAEEKRRYGIQQTLDIYQPRRKKHSS